MTARTYTKGQRVLVAIPSMLFPTDGRVVQATVAGVSRDHTRIVRVEYDDCFYTASELVRVLS